MSGVQGAASARRGSEVRESVRRRSCDEPLGREVDAIDRAIDAAFEGAGSHREMSEMPSPRDGSTHPHGRRRRARRDRHAAHAARAHDGVGAPDDEVGELAGIDESLLSEDERALLQARRRAERKVDLVRDVVKAALYTVPCLIFVWPLGVVLLVMNSLRLGRRAYRELLEPQVRDRLVADEVARRVDARVHAQRVSIEGEHARSLEQLSASIAHEIRNPITAAKSLVQQMGEEPASLDNVEYAQVALAELERVERSVSHLLRFARDEDLCLQPLRLADIADSAIETFRERVEREGVAIARSYDCAGELAGDPEKLRRVVINLVGNAVDAVVDEDSDAGRRVEVSLGENLARSEVWLRVRDTGPGIDAAVRERIFDPFLTNKSSGTGLGLSITRKLVEAHAGRIEVRSAAGAGSEFIVTLPRRAAAAAGEGDDEASR